MTDHVNCGWCEKGGDNSGPTGEVCESCIQQVADELEGDHVQ